MFLGETIFIAPREKGENRIYKIHINTSSYLGESITFADFVD